MKKIALVMMLCLLCAATLLPAQVVTGAIAVDDEKESVGQLLEIRATVQEINLDTRDVTLKSEEGNVFTVAVGEEARNLEQLVVGDRVQIQYYEQLTLTLEKIEDGMPAMKEQVAGDRAALGEKPGGIQKREVTITAKIVAIDTEASTVTLTGPKGRSVTLEVAPERLNRVKVGDLVSAIYHEALAIAVAKVPADKK